MKRKNNNNNNNNVDVCRVTEGLKEKKTRMRVERSTNFDYSNE